MEKTEAVRRALAELGDAPAEQVAAFIPVIKATLLDREMLERARASRAAVPEGGLPTGAS